MCLHCIALQKQARSVQVFGIRESLQGKMLYTIIKTYGGTTYSRTLRQFRRTALPSDRCYDHTCILVGNSLISFSPAFQCRDNIVRQAIKTLASYNLFHSVLMCSHCSNWDCCQFMDPWSNRIRRFPIGGLVFCSNLRLTGKLTKITPLMTDNQCRPYKEPIGLSNTRRTCLVYCLSFLLSKKAFKPCW